MSTVAQLRTDGAAKGLCRLYQAKLRDGLSVRELADIYKQGIDFCIMNDYPTLDFMREHYKGKCEEYGIYVDGFTGKLENPETVIANGDCRMVAKYGGFSVARIYARHNTTGAVNVTDFANVTIDIFDNAHLAIAVTGGDARVFVNLHGVNATVETIGQGIILKNKNAY